MGSIRAPVPGRLQRLVDVAIRRYQAGGGGLERLRVDCNFTPTCSEYARQAVLRFGALRGLRLGWRRIRRCTDPDCVTRIEDPVPGRWPGSGPRRAGRAGAGSRDPGAGA